MVDISASLSLTPSAPGIDPAVVTGAESTDLQAFGNILAGQVQAAADQSTTIDTPALLPLPAGNRQPGGKILPGATEILPAVAAPTLEIPTAQALPALWKAAANPPAATVPPAPAEATESTSAETAEAGPAQLLIRMVAQTIRGAKATKEAPAAAPTDPEGMAAETTNDAEPGEPVAADPTTLTPFPLQFALPVLPLAATAPQPQDTAPLVSAEGAATAKAPILPAVETPLQLAKAATFALAEPASPSAAQPAVPAVPAQAAQPASVPATRVAQIEAQSAVLPTITATPAEVSAVPVTLIPDQARAVGRTTTARIKVDPATPAIPATPATPALRAEQAIPAEHKPAADRIVADFASPVAPALADAQSQTGSTAPATPAATAFTAGVPRHDLAALVDRLIEARNASATPAVHASVNHAEFGQVSLQFQHDGKDLSVSMTSADPGFAVAAQAAMPTERAAANADTGSRSQSQAQAQSAGSNANHEAAGQRGADAASDQQNRGGQGRNPRGGANGSNPSPRWSDRDQPQSRNGIFA